MPKSGCKRLDAPMLATSVAGIGRHRRAVIRWFQGLSAGKQRRCPAASAGSALRAPRSTTGGGTRRIARTCACRREDAMRVKHQKCLFCCPAVIIHDRKNVDMSIARAKLSPPFDSGYNRGHERPAITSMGTTAVLAGRHAGPVCRRRAGAGRARLLARQRRRHPRRSAAPSAASWSICWAGRRRSTCGT